MSKIDPFTSQRIRKFIEEFRVRSGQLPTLKDFEAAGITRDSVELAVRSKVIEQFYVTLSNGVVMKGFKVSAPS